MIRACRGWIGCKYEGLNIVLEDSQWKSKSKSIIAIIQKILTENSKIIVNRVLKQRNKADFLYSLLFWDDYSLSLFMRSYNMC